MEKLKRLPHKYAHNRRYYELKSRLWNLISQHFDEKDTITIIDAAEIYPDRIKKLIDQLPVHELVIRSAHQYVDWLVELKGIIN